MSKSNNMPEKSRFPLQLLRIKGWLVKNTGQLVQLAWIAFAVLILSLVLAGMPYRFTELQVICDTPRCIFGQPTTESISQLIQQGLKITPEYLRGEAFNKIAIESILHVIIFCLALVLIWQERYANAFRQMMIRA